MKYQIECTLYAGTSGVVDLGEKTWADVEEWYVKWDTLNVLFEGNSEYTQIDLNSVVQDVVDWKRPTSVSVFARDAQGNVNHDEEIAEA